MDRKQRIRDAATLVVPRDEQDRHSRQGKTLEGGERLSASHASTRLRYSRSPRGPPHPPRQCGRAPVRARDFGRSHRRGDAGRHAAVPANPNRCACLTRTTNARHTHQSAVASRASASAGPLPKRSATGVPAAARRLSSVVNTRKRSKHPTVKSSRRAITGR